MTKDSTISTLLTPIHLLDRRRVPVRQQMTITECGAACLAMILSYYGRETTVAECSEKCGTGRDGVTARAIVRAAREFGLRVRAYSLKPADLHLLALPAIVHWDFNHFVVLERWSPNKVQIVDPRSGRLKMTAAEFDASFTGVALTLEPGVQFSPGRRSQAPLWLNYLKDMLTIPRVRGVLIQTLLTSMTLQILGLLLPLFTKVVVDQVLPFHITNVMTAIGIGMLLFAVAQMFITYLRSVTLIYLRGRLDSHLMVSFFEHMLLLPFSFFQMRSSGDLLLRLGSNSLIREMLTNQTLSVILDGSFVFFYLLILLLLAPQFGLLAMALGAVQALIMLGARGRLRHLMQRDLATRAEEQSYLVEAMKGIALLKASGAEDRAFERWSDLFFKQLNVSLERSHLTAALEAVIGTLRNVSPLLLLWFGSLAVLKGEMELGTMLAFTSLAIAFLSPVTTFVATIQQLQVVGANLERIADVLEKEPEQPLKPHFASPRLTGRIEVKNVSFKYSLDAPWVLRNISFVVAPGEKVALAGFTGSGKSTLAMLLLGLYEPTEGEILYDGVPMVHFNYRSLRRQFGVVLQEPFLFSGSIRQNIALLHPSISMDEVIRAAQLAGIHDEILRMPMAYETMISEGGTTLSGGQRQRLAIARALAGQPSMLLLDEATSHLDTTTEAEINRNLSALSCSQIVIAHRLSTIYNADHIMVLHQGSIIEQGSHEELFAREGYYAALVKSQLKNDAADLCPSHAM